MNSTKEKEIDISEETKQQIKNWNIYGTRQLIAGFVISFAVTAGLWIS